MRKPSPLLTRLTRRFLSPAMPEAAPPPPEPAHKTRPGKTSQRKAVKAAPRHAASSGPANFALLIGAMKCGTTSVYDYLVTHPQVARCSVKEPNFFGGETWSKGPDYYRGLWKDYDPALHSCALEASVYYTKLPQYRHTATRIAKFPGKFKFLYIVRDPI